MAGIVLLIYIVWAIGQTFDKNIKINYLKAFLAYLLGAITLFLFLILLGAFLNLFIKH